MVAGDSHWQILSSDSFLKSSMLNCFLSETVLTMASIMALSDSVIGDSSFLASTFTSGAGAETGAVASATFGVSSASVLVADTDRSGFELDAYNIKLLISVIIGNSNL